MNNNNPHFPQRHLYILSSKKTIIQCILWSTGKNGKIIIWMYMTDIPHASVLNNSWIQRNVSACYCTCEIYTFFSSTYMNCFQVCPPDLFVSCASFLTVWVRLCCTWLWFAALCWRSAQGWIYYQTIRWHSHPEHILIMYHRSDSDFEKLGDTSNSIQNNETHKINVLNLLSMVLKA